MKDVNLLTQNGVNLQESLELFGDMTTYDETLKDFLDAIDEKLTSIKTYKEEGDMANYAILVHSLKSDARYLGFTKLAELAYNHEMASKANNLNFVYEDYDNLMNEAKRIVALVKKYLLNEEVKEEQEEIVIKDKTILVVDDSDLVRNFIKKIFNDTYEVLQAKDGKEAIDIISLNTQNKIVGMFLDLNMPNVDGFEVLEYFKQNSLFVKIPVSIITGVDDRENINRATSYPIADVLVKPFNEASIKNVVEKTINFNK